MRLTKFTLGQVVSIGIAAVVFILALKFVGTRWNIPIITPVARTV